MDPLPGLFVIPPEPVVPTAEGRRRYPPDGMYDGDLPCTCAPTCPEPCRDDACECEACAEACDWD